MPLNGEPGQETAAIRRLAHEQLAYAAAAGPRLAACTPVLYCSKSSILPQRAPRVFSLYHFSSTAGGRFSRRRNEEAAGRVSGAERPGIRALHVVLCLLKALPRAHVPTGMLRHFAAAGSVAASRTPSPVRPRTDGAIRAAHQNTMNA